MTIEVREQSSTIQLKEIFTNEFTKRLWIDCKDVGGHWYFIGECTRCGHDVRPDIFEEDCDE